MILFQMTHEAVVNACVQNWHHVTALAQGPGGSLGEGRLEEKA